MSQLDSPLTLSVINEVLNKAVILLNVNETPSSFIDNNSTENDLMSYNLAINNYSKIIMEAEVKSFHNAIDDDVSYAYRFKQGATTEDSFEVKIVGSTTYSLIGGNIITHLKTTINGGQTSAVVLKLTGQISDAVSGLGLQALSFRIYATY
jgi:hypothetical protein